MGFVRVFLRQAVGQTLVEFCGMDAMMLIVAIVRVL